MNDHSENFHFVNRIGESGDGSLDVLLPPGVADGSTAAGLTSQQEEIKRLTLEIQEMRRLASHNAERYQMKVNELKRVERVLERAKREWETTFDSVTDMIILTDCAGNIIRCNQAACKSLNKSFSELVNSSIEPHFFGSYAVDSWVFHSESIDTWFPLLEKWFEVANFPLIICGESTGMVHIIKDISNLNRTPRRVDSRAG